MNYLDQHKIKKGDQFKVSILESIHPQIRGRPVVVQEVKLWGIIGNAHIPFMGGLGEIQVRLTWDQIEDVKK